MIRQSLRCLLLVMIMAPALHAQGDSTLLHIRSVEVHGVAGVKTARQIAREARRLKSTPALQRQAVLWSQRQALAGRLEFSLETYEQADDVLHLHFHEGPAYVYEAIEINGLSEAYRQRSGIERLVEKQAPLDWEDLETRLRHCLNI